MKINGALSWPGWPKIRNKRKESYDIKYKTKRKLLRSVVCRRVIRTVVCSGIQRVGYNGTPVVDRPCSITLRLQMLGWPYNRPVGRRIKKSNQINARIESGDRTGRCGVFLLRLLLPDERKTVLTFNCKRSAMMADSFVKNLSSSSHPASKMLCGK